MRAGPTSLRGLFAELRTPRYAALTLLMIVVAGVCVAAGTWQISRYDGKHVANDDLRRNAHAPAAPAADVLPVLGPAGSGALPAEDAVQYRTVTATGVYDTDHQLLVRKQQVDSTNGYLVLTPLRTATAELLVVRGFVPDTTPTLRPDEVAPPPAGTVTVRGWVQTNQAADDKFRQLDNGQIDVINVRSAAARLGGALFGGYVELGSGQPGTAGLTAIPAPDLSNPAGGAFELQHLAYIVQWYLFAALALAAPVVMVATDRRRAGQDRAAAAGASGSGAGDAISDAGSGAPAPVSTPQQRLADRYGR